MGSGLARGAAARGKRIAFGDGERIIWDPRSEEVFRYNPNVAWPLSNMTDIEWVKFHRGHRIYNRQGNGCWVWNYDFRPTPGEFFFCPEEIRFGKQSGKGFVVIEPNLPPRKQSSANKRWPTDRYLAVATRLRQQGFEVVQFAHPATQYRLGPARHVSTGDFRRAASVLANAALYLGPEGGLHHAAAAVGIPAVVLFGGFIPPQVTGYPGHANLTGNATEACGRLAPCAHCAAAMESISVDAVVDAALEKLNA